MVNDILDVMKQNNVEVDMPDINDRGMRRSGMTANPILLQKKYSRVMNTLQNNREFHWMHR